MFPTLDNDWQAGAAAENAPSSSSIFVPRVGSWKLAVLPDVSHTILEDHQVDLSNPFIFHLLPTDLKPSAKKTLQ